MTPDRTPRVPPGRPRYGAVVGEDGFSVAELGLVTPGLTALPRAANAWEATAEVADVAQVVVAADRLGFGLVTCSEHVAVPHDAAERRGARYWDPLATFGYLAARTTQVRLLTYVLVLGYHHPLAIAKQYGTLDRVSGGRVVLGVGVGSLEEEFDLLGVPFADRGERADDALRALRAALGVGEPTYEGSHHRFAGMVVDPCALQERVPLWVGGRTRRSLRRAVELADGWAPFGLEADEVAGALAASRETPAWSARTEPLEVVLQPPGPLDPMADPGGTRAALDDLHVAGATRVLVRTVHRSPAQAVEQLEALAALAVR